MEKENENEYPNIRKLPFIATRGMTVFPGMIVHFDLEDKNSMEAAGMAMSGSQEMILTMPKSYEIQEPLFEDLHEYGTLAVIKQITKMPNHVTHILVEGISRVKMIALEKNGEGMLYATVQVIPEPQPEDHDITQTAMLRTLMELTTQYALHFPKVAKSLQSQIKENMSLPQLLDRMAMNMPIPYEKKQELLSAVTIKERFELMAKILYEETEIADIRGKIAEDMKERVEKNQRDYILREQMEYIKQELGGNDSYSDQEIFEAQLKQLEASDEVKEKIQKEIDRFAKISDSSLEGAVERGYLETLLELPWDRVSKDTIDIDRAEKILNKNHYGMEKVKDRILEFLAVKSLTNAENSPILCLVGPPGTGKTSIAKSVAEALNKKYLRICLGGVRDEAEIRGHRRTYVGAMPGRIAAGLRQAGVKNPLMLLDEIDKVSSDYKGDTFSALLEVLDPDQNNRFRDHYVDIPMDLSRVLFLATANSVSNIPRPLLDRMEVIEVSGYTENEKFHIAKEHLMHKQYAANGMTRKILSVSDKALKDVIRSYTREAGVRELERKIGEICRKAAREFLQEQPKKVTVSGANLSKYLGKPRYSTQMANKENEIGIVRGLAWTAVGGETLQIEVNRMPGKGELELTGQMGDVMKESAHIGISYIRSIAGEYGIKPDIFKKSDFHIHIPEGAVQKDGPSAGITMAAAMLSVLTGKKVYAKIAMTGEITLRGNVLAVGGLKEKILAAKMAGIETVLVPKENEKDIEEISGEITQGLSICYVETMKDVIKHAFVGENTGAV